MTPNFKTVNLNIEANDSDFIISKDGNTNNEPWQLVLGFIWDRGTNKTDADYIEVVPLGQNTAVRIYNTNYYESPNETKYNQIRIPQGTTGMFTYFYNLQGDVDEEVENNDTWVGITWYRGEQEFNLSEEYLDVISIRLEPFSTSEGNKVILEDIEISLSDGLSRVYYYPDMFTKKPFYISSGIDAYIYGRRYEEKVNGNE